MIPVLLFWLMIDETGVYKVQCVLHLYCRVLWSCSVPVLICVIIGGKEHCLWMVKSNRSALRPKIQLKCNDSPSVQSVKEEVLLAAWAKARFEREQSETDSEHQSVWIILPLTGCSLYTPYSDSHHTRDRVKRRTMPSNTKPMWRWSNLHLYRRQSLYCCSRQDGMPMRNW